MGYAYEQQAATAAASAAVMAEKAAPARNVTVAAPGYCPYLGQDCEPGNEWQCKQPEVATAASCQEACDKCSGGLCVATVLSEGKCHFRGCDSSCMVFQKSTCPTERARACRGHWCNRMAATSTP